MNAPADWQDRVYRILSDLSAVPQKDIRPEDRLREDLGLDSVGSMELLSMLAEQFEIDVEMEEAVRARDVRGVIDLARRHLDA